MQVNVDNKKAEINYGLKLSNYSRVECSISHNLIQSLSFWTAVTPLSLDSSYYNWVII